MPPVRLAVIPGDGVGPEVTAEALRVLRVVERSSQVPFDIVEFPWGTDHYLRTGHVAPPDFLEVLRGFDAILLGAMGDPRVPDHIPVGLVLQIRKQFDLYVNLRPIRLVPGVPTPLAHRPTIDILFVRENTEGEYSESGGRLHTGSQDEIAVHTAVFTTRGIERVAVYAFERARRRRRLVTSVSKANALPHTFGLWDEVVKRVATRYPDVTFETILVDAMAYHMVRRPDRFDVVVASNLFGDILTDLGAALQGGLGLAASANLNPNGHPAMFEPVHGSAPDIAGRGIANPVGAIWSAALALEYLAHRGRLPGGNRFAEVVMQAITDVLRAGPHTPDLGGSASTSDVGKAITERVTQLLES